MTRLERLLQAARAVAGNRARLAGEIMHATGLSREGVELAFTRHFELYPTAEELASLERAAGHAARVHVILSANVFTAPLRAIALAYAASERVTVRPSRRDPVVARELVSELGDPNVTIASDDAVDEGEIHVYGRDETIAAVRAAARVPVKGHGTGMGIVVLSPRADLEDAAQAIADDVIPFDQRGCLSPRVVFVERGAERLAEHLHRALAATRVPRGQLTAEERAEARRWIDSATVAGEVLEGEDHVVAVGRGLLVPPPGRHVQVVPFERLDLHEIGRFVVAVGTDDPDRHALPPHARISPPGMMQRPPLDGPVDRRVG
jgi:acyl-CoA reductase-like NAD-dependent aldehyde dehydrogenase